MMRGRLLLLGFCLAASSFPAIAQTQSPEQFTLRVAQTAKAGDWKAYAQLMHPDALAAMKRIFAEAVRAGTAGGEVVRKMFGVTTVEELQALPDAEMFVMLFSFLEKNLPNFQSMVRDADIQPIGSVQEPPDVAHVVVRTGAKVDQLGLSRMSVMSVKRHQGEWRALLSGNLEGLARQITAARKMAPPK